MPKYSQKGTIQKEYHYNNIMFNLLSLILYTDGYECDNDCLLRPLSLTIKFLFMMLSRESQSYRCIALSVPYNNKLSEQVENILSEKQI